MKGDQADFDLIVSPEYLNRYHACNRILAANGIPIQVTEIRPVFSNIAFMDVPLSEEKRQRCLLARENLIKFIEGYGKPPDPTTMTLKELSEKLLDACHCVSEKPDIRKIRELVELGADLSIRDENGFSAFQKAVRIYDHEIMKFFLEHGADINEVNHYTSGGSSSVWIEKAGYASIGDLELMLKHNAIVNDRDSDGNTALIKYCSANPVREGVALLLKHGADAAPANNDGETALHALSGKNVEGGIFKLLIDHGGDVNAGNGMGDTPLHSGSRFALAGDERGTIALLDSGANPDIINREGETPLILAARCDKEKVVKTLVEHGARLETMDKSGKTAYEIALEKGYLKTAAQIKTCAEDDYKSRPEHAVLEKIKAQIIEKMKSGFGQNRSDKEGCSTFSWKHGAYLYERFEYGASPPDVTTYSSDADALKFLYETNHTRSATETEVSVYQEILNSLHQL